jgi:hypothetical protein
MIREIVGHPLDRGTDFDLPIEFEDAAGNVDLRKGKRRHGDLLVIVQQGHILQKDFSLECDLVGVRGQDALIKTLHWRKCGLVTQQQLDEIQAFDMATEDDQARGDGCG